MRKIIIIMFIVSIYLCLGGAKTVNAALVTVDNDWNIKINVLSYQSDAEYELTKVVENLAEAKNSRLSLVKNGEQVEMKLDGENIDWNSDVYPTDEEIVEIERNRAPDNIKVFSTEEGFNIEQTGYIAKTSLPIVIDSKNKSLALETQKGSEYLLFLPKDVVQSLQQSGTISGVGENSIVLAQDAEGGLYYQVEGSKNIKLLKLIDIDVVVIARLDAGTGRVLNVDQPIWLSLFGFMLG